MECWPSILAFLCVLALAACTSASLTLSSDQQANTTLPTCDYFQASPPSFSYPAALLLRIHPQSNGTRCRFVRFEHNATASMREASAVVGLLNWNEAKAVGCHNYYHAVAKALKHWQPSIKDAYLPPVRLFAIESSLPYPGKPAREPYVSHTWELQDGPPPLPTVILYDEQARQLRDATQNASVVEHVDVRQERGPWNREYLSLQFILYKWLHFGINAAMLAISTYMVIRSALLGLLRFDWRFFIFVAGYIATAAYAASLLLPELTLVRNLMEIIKGIGFPFAFYTLLLLWVNVLSIVPRPHVYIPMQVLACLGMCATLLNFCTTTLRLFQVANSETANLVNIYLLLITQFAVAIVFFVYGIRFQRRKAHATTMSNNYAYDALSRLAWLAIVGSGANLILFVVNLFDDRLLGKPTIYFEVLVIMVRSFASTIRAAAILLILSVRLPEKRPPPMQMSATATYMKQLKSPVDEDDDSDYEAGRGDAGEKERI